MKTASLRSLLGLGPIPQKSNSRRAYGWQFVVTNDGRQFKVTNLDQLCVGDIVRAEYLGGNGILQLTHRRALGMPGNGETVLITD